MRNVECWRKQGQVWDVVFGNGRDSAPRGKKIKKKKEKGFPQLQGSNRGVTAAGGEGKHQNREWGCALSGVHKPLRCLTAEPTRAGIDNPKFLLPPKACNNSEFQNGLGWKGV